MGLDMFFFERKNQQQEKVDEIAYWRKHHDLHGFFEEEWNNVGRPNAHKDNAEFFNCVRFPLTEDILTRAIKAIEEDELPPTTGLFFGDGSYYSTDYFVSKSEAEGARHSDIAIMRDAIARIKSGSKVYYDSWW